METILLTDGYKLDHRRQYPEGTEYVYSNWTPRSNHYYPEADDGVVVFGIQYLIKKYFIDDFKKNFFDLPKKEAVDAFERRVFAFIGPNKVGRKHIEDLHDLGYLPIEVKALPEGSLCPIRVPCMTVINTLPEFFWVTNYLETLLSCVLWMPMTSATTARLFKRRLIEHMDTVGVKLSNTDLGFLCHDFSMRGMPGIEAAIISGLGHLTSFNGSETIPASEAAEEYYNINADNELVSSTVPACYSDDTEVLTNSGWKFFKDLDDEDLVAEFKDNYTIDFVKPLEIIKDRYKGKMIHYHQDCKPSRIDMIVTPNHRMVYSSTYSKKIKLFEAKKGLTQSSYTGSKRLVMSGNTSNNQERHLSALDKLKIAFQADGSYPSHYDDYDGSRSKAFPIRFSLKKQRKMDRLEKLFAEANVQYNKSKYNNGYYSIWANVPEEFKKDFSWVELDKLSFNECCEFLDELQFWDGRIANNSIVYSSINKSCVDKVQAIANICGYTGCICEYMDKRDDCDRKMIYSVTLSKRVDYGIAMHLNVDEVDYDGFVYCVSVPSKMIIVRRNNKALVCGNTEHSVMCAGGMEDEFGTFKRLITEVYPDGFVSIVSDTWDFWKVIDEYMPALKDIIMARNGRVVIRPDSGDPVDIVAGLNPADVFEFNGKKYYVEGLSTDAQTEHEISKLRRNNPDALSKYEVTESQVKGAYERLCEIFGYTVNEKGYKILDSHIGMIYGDSINLDRQNRIYQRLEAKGIAATNLVLGIGSFSMTYRTRDSLGFAMKATWCQINGQPKEIFKHPKTDSGMKNSLKGLICVKQDENGKYYAVDQVSKEEEENSCLTTVFKDGVITRETSLPEIRYRVNESIENYFRQKGEGHGDA